MSKKFFMLAKDGRFLIKAKYNSDSNILLIDEKSDQVLELEYDEKNSEHGHSFRVISNEKVPLTKLNGEVILDEEEKEIMVNKPVTNKYMLDFLFNVRAYYLSNQDPDDYDYEDEDEEDYDEDEFYEYDDDFDNSFE